MFFQNFETSPLNILPLGGVVFFNQLPFYASRTKFLWRPLGCKITTTFGSKCSSEEGTKKRKEQDFINFKKKQIWQKICGDLWCVKF